VKEPLARVSESISGVLKKLTIAEMMETQKVNGHAKAESAELVSLA
jgi:hypothetical protein